MSGGQIDHAAAAVDWVENSVKAQASQQPNNELLAAAYAGVGQVHATLALVEQQRISNIIALAQGGHGGLIGFEREATSALGAMSGEAWGAEMKLHAAIKEALGLS